MEIILAKRKDLKNRFIELKKESKKDKESKINFNKSRESSVAIIKNSKKLYKKSSIKTVLKLATLSTSIAMIFVFLHNMDIPSIIDQIQSNAEAKVLSTENLSIVKDKAVQTLKNLTNNELFKDLFISTLSLGIASKIISIYKKSQKKQDIKKVQCAILENELEKDEINKLEKLAKKKGASIGLAPEVYVAKNMCRNGRLSNAKESFQEDIYDEDDSNIVKENVEQEMSM